MENINFEKSDSILGLYEEDIEKESENIFDSLKEIELFKFEDQWNDDLDFLNVEHFNVEQKVQEKPETLTPLEHEDELNQFLEEKESMCPTLSKTKSHGAEVESIKTKQEKQKFKQSKAQKVELAERKDVVNRAILRGIKKYFLEAFLKVFQDYKTKRICRVHKASLLNDVRLFCEKSHTKDDLVKAIFCMIRPNSISFVSESAEYIEEVNSFLNCIQKYSHTKLNTVIGTKFAKILFQYIFENSERTQEFIDMNPCMMKHPEAYRQGIERFLQFIHE